jgi:hypothetical protein
MFKVIPGRFHPAIRWASQPVWVWLVEAETSIPSGTEHRFSGRPFYNVATVNLFCRVQVRFSPGRHISVATVTSRVEYHKASQHMYNSDTKHPSDEACQQTIRGIFSVTQAPQLTQAGTM